MPWPVGIVLGILGFFAVRYGVGFLFASGGGPVATAWSKAGIAGAFAPLAWVVLGICWAAALASFIKQKHRRRLLEAQTGLDSIRAMHWAAFEMLVGEAFRRQGYTVEETGLGGADGGIDLILRKQGLTTLVQCKQWRTQQVSVKVVREMFGLLAHHQASGVFIVSTGDYTADAKRFAEGKSIELINGDQLLAMVRSVQTTPTWSAVKPTMSETMAALPATEQTPECPSCGIAMIRRENRRTQKSFWGCPSYPRCRGTRDVPSVDSAP